jgi:multicomponent Na+:H+ antiporter subunit C
MSLSMMLYGTSLILFLIGLYGLLARRNLIRMVIGLSIAELGVNLFLVTVGYVDGGIAPIFPGDAARMVDPIPHALVLTAIVIGFGITALALTLVMRIHASQGTIDTARMRGLKW